MVAKFMLLAFFLEALIELYVPSEWISRLLGPDNPWAIAAAAVIGVPVYTNNLAALAMVGGLLAQGMNPAAGLAFLIAGPTTTIPAIIPWLFGGFLLSATITFVGPDTRYWILDLRYLS